MVKQLDQKLGFEKYAWSVAEGVASWAGDLLDCDLVSALGDIDSYAEARKALKRKSKLEPNPHFVANGIESNGTKLTEQYFRGRRGKSILGTAIGHASKAATAVTVVDVGGIAKEGQAAGLSVAHAVKLKAVAKRYRQSETVTAWIDLVHKLKCMKAAIRGTGVVGAAVPFAAVGVVTECLQSAGKRGVKLTYGNVASRTAMELHWRAYQERKLGAAFGGGKGAGGPACAILYELFTKRGLTRIFGKYDVDAFIAEAPGWLAVKDKIMLI